MRAARAWHRLVEVMPRPAMRSGAPFLGTWRLFGPVDASEDPGAARVLESGSWSEFDERTVNRAYDDYNDVLVWAYERDGRAPADRAVAYLTAWVHSSQSHQAELRLGATGPLSAWWDGDRTAVLDGWTVRRDSTRHRLEISEGWHRLLLRLPHVGGPWGFYARLSDPRGNRLEDVTASLSGPGELQVDTWALPAGFARWPYVELDNPRGEPRASAFELTGGGGQPPYRWSLAAGELPAGLELSESGALRGTPHQPGEGTIEVEVRDADGTATRRSLQLRVAPAPTAWYAHNPLGVLVHFDKPTAVPLTTWDREMADRPGYAERWAALAAGAGAAVLTITAKHHDSWTNWPSQVHRADGVVAQRTGTDSVGTTRAAAAARGLRFGIYFSTLDTWHPGYRSDVPSFLRFQFRQLQELVERYRPSLVWLDGHWDEPRRNWAYDPLCSLVHGLVPEAVIANNPGRRTLNVGDSGYGDVDVRTFEGHRYWDHMPAPQASGRNPRPLPGQKLAFTCNWWSPGLEPEWLGCERNNCWGEWVRVLSRLVAGGNTLLLGVGPGFPGAPAGAPEPGELYPQAAQILERLGSWLNPDRAEAFVGVVPGPLPPGRWGTCVQRGGRIYLHVAPGKDGGWPRPQLRLGPLADALPVTYAYLLPDRTPVPWSTVGDDLVLELAGLAPDPVLSIVAIDVRDGRAAARTPANA